MSLDDLRFTLASVGWQEIIKAKLEEQQKATLNQLATLPGARPKPEGWTSAPTDDFLRGYFNGVSFALNHWQSLISEGEAAQTRREIARAEEEGAPAGSPYATEPLVDTSASKA